MNIESIVASLTPGTVLAIGFVVGFLIAIIKGPSAQKSKKVKEPESRTTGGNPQAVGEIKNGIWHMSAKEYRIIMGLDD